MFTGIPQPWLTARRRISYCVAARVVARNEQHQLVCWSNHRSNHGDTMWAERDVPRVGQQCHRRLGRRDRLLPVMASVPGGTSRAGDGDRPPVVVGVATVPPGVDDRPFVEPNERDVAARLDVGSRRPPQHIDAGRGDGRCRGRGLFRMNTLSVSRARTSLTYTPAHPSMRLQQGPIRGHRRGRRGTEHRRGE